MLPDDGTALTPRSVIVALLALISGEEAAAAVSAALGLAEYRLTGHSERTDQRGIQEAGRQRCLIFGSLRGSIRRRPSRSWRTSSLRA